MQEPVHADHPRECHGQQCEDRGEEASGHGQVCRITDSHYIALCSPARDMLKIWLLLTWSLAWARADVLPLDDARPWLVSAGVPVDWTSGGGAFVLASSPVIRLNYRGVTLERPGSVLRDLAPLGWSPAYCNISARGLCASEFGVAFRVQQAGAPVVSDNPDAQLPPDWHGLHCANAVGRGLTYRPQYDLSACDLLDEGADVVFGAGVLYFRRSALPLGVYWALVVGAILLVRAVARNVQAHRERATPDLQRVPLAAATACILLVAREGEGLYATEGDHAFYLATMGYCICYLGYHVYFFVHARAQAVANTEIQSEQPPVFNLAAGVLQLIVSRLYTGAETPYNPIILLIVCTRALTKLRRPSAGHALTGLLDASYVALACELGFMPDPVYMVALIACADLIAEIYFTGGSG